MRKSTLAKIVVASLLSVVGVSAANADTSWNPPVRAYYVGAQDQMYYVDHAGNKVFQNKCSSEMYSGLNFIQDTNGRWYSQDSFGNRIYKDKRCM